MKNLITHSFKRCYVVVKNIQMMKLEKDVHDESRISSAVFSK
jgi:hypothetical protein